MPSQKTNRESAFDRLVKGLEEARVFLKTGKIPGGRVHIPKEIDAATIRAKAGLSQAAFAREIGVSVGTLRSWEQGRRVPVGPARVLLTMLSKDPLIVRRTLKPAA